MAVVKLIQHMALSFVPRRSILFLQVAVRPQPGLAPCAILFESLLHLLNN
jgi:hypothetical protein